MRTKIFNNTDVLRAIPLPTFDGSYVTVPHYEVDQLVNKVIKANGFEVMNSKYQSCKEGKIVISKYSIGTPNPTFNYEISTLNSYDKSKKLTFVQGIQTAICSNGMVCGEFVYLRKHTGDVWEEFESMVNGVALEYTSMLDTAQRRKDTWDCVILGKKGVSELVGRMFIERELVNTEQLNIIKSQINDPIYNYDSVKNSLYDLYQHVTFATRNNYPAVALEKRKGIEDFFVNHYMNV